MSMLEEAHGQVVGALSALRRVIRALESEESNKTQNKRKAARLVTQLMYLDAVRYYLEKENERA